MARSDPTRSRYCATRHLLRNLDRPKSLRRNPLARDAFATESASDAARIIRARVDAAFRTMEAQESQIRRWDAARQSAILLRVDVARHDAAAVAADLGLSIRQFHRTRRTAHERFYAAYGAAMPTISTHVSGDFAPQMLARAGSLADSGETASATAILADVATGAARDDLRVEALTRLAETDLWTHRLPRARRYLDEAAKLLTTVTLDEPRRQRLLDEYEAVALSLHWFAEGPAAIHHSNGSEHHGADAHGRAALVRAAAALHNGEASYAKELLQRLDPAAPGLQTPEAIVDLLVLRGALLDFNAESASLSEELFTRAAAVARERGLRGRELYATHQLYVTRWVHSRSAGDRSAYRALVDSIDRSLPARLRSHLIFSSADAELAIGHPRRAIAAAEAASAVSTNRYESFSARALAAGALLRLGCIDEAGAQARLAGEAARAQGHARVLSLAQRINAQAQLSRGNRREARIAIEESIECARHFSSVHVLAQAQAVRGKIIAR